MKHHRRSTDPIDPKNPHQNPHFPGGIPFEAWQAGYEGRPANCPPGGLYESWYRQGAAARSYDCPSWSERLASWFMKRYIDTDTNKQTGI